jgi:coproporphyrinogen III oxidase
MNALRTHVHQLVKQAQDDIVNAISTVEPTPFQEDHWQRPGGGGGRSRVLQDGDVFEKAGVNTSAVHGTLSEQAARSMQGTHGFETAERDFYATGVSLVLHPKNPMAPTVHANFRYFELGKAGNPAAWWFGGGADLTPSYLFDEDARHFHTVLKQACDKTDPAYYPAFKKRCDDYFWIPHREEARGVGGIFFDSLRDREPEQLAKFLRDCCTAFPEAYLPILKRRYTMPFSEAQRQWQLMRRGRYVEFNLVYDRGTQFGLRTSARIESVLMSLPLHARWEYCPEVIEGSEEHRLLQVLREPVDWVEA